MKILKENDFACILGNSFNFRFCIKFCNFRTIRTFSEPAGIKYWIVRKASARTERTKIRVFLILIKKCVFQLDRDLYNALRHA